MRRLTSKFDKNKLIPIGTGNSFNAKAGSMITL